MSEELKPCPFCGGEATVINMDDYFMAHCECGVNYEGPTADDCVEAWNNRAPLPAEQPSNPVALTDERKARIVWDAQDATDRATEAASNDVSNSDSAVLFFDIISKAIIAESGGAMAAPESDKALAHGHRDDWYLMANARRIGMLPIACVKGMQNWAFAKQLFATGSTSAVQICSDAGIDPDGYTVARIVGQQTKGDGNESG